MTALLGDQRRFAIVLSTPAEGSQVPLTIHELTITFDTEPNHAAVEHALAITPAIPGVARWRGKTIVYTFTGPLAVGEYRVSLAAGQLGRSSQRLAAPFNLTFTVRKPGIALVTTQGQNQALVAIRDGLQPATILLAPQIVDFAISPDGSRIAVVTSTSAGNGGLVLVDPDGRNPQAIVQTPDIDIGGVAWSADSNALLVVRRDRLPSGDEGVPRVWLTRITGEFVAPIDPAGHPSLYPAWSPDAQSLAYVSPADGRLVVQNLSTHDEVNLGQPRGGVPAWSPDSTKIVFESVPPDAATSSTLIQPIRIRGVDGVYDKTIGGPGESRTAPRFLDNETIMDMRRTVGENGRGTELLFESLKDGSLLRSVQLAPGGAVVTDWDLDPTHGGVVFSILGGTGPTTVRLDLDSGERTIVTPSGLRPRWLP